MQKLIIGLGNPEIQYGLSRHNIGKMFLNTISKNWESTSLGDIDVNPKYILFKPDSHMNLCGSAVKNAIALYNIDISNIVVVHDCVELVLGKIKLRKEGSAKGHNGVKSIIHHLGTDKFSRLRIGIGKTDASLMCEYVLSSFTLVEKKMVENEIFPECKTLLGL